MSVTRVLRVDAAEPDAGAIEEAAAVIRRGGLVAFPTETVYGLGAAALDASAVDGIFAAKGRPSTDPLIVHLADAGQLDTVAAEVTSEAQRLADAFWPGPLTLVLAKQPAVPGRVTAGRPTVAVRVPSHPVARAFLAACGIPVAAPSANRFSRPSPTRAEHVLAELDGLVDVVLDGGATPIGVESTIVDCSVTPPVLLRPGGITREQLETVVSDLVILDRYGRPDEAQRAPGQLLRHYAPSARVTVYTGPAAAVQARLAAEARHLAGGGTRVGLLVFEEDAMALAPSLAALASSGRVRLRTFGRRDNVAAAAHALFDVLRQFEIDGVEVILAAAPPVEGLGAAVLDRLTRAAEGRVVGLISSAPPV